MKRLSKKIAIRVSMAATLAVLLVGCAKHKAEKPFVAPLEKPTLNQIRSAYIHTLEANGVQVIHIGQQIQIVLRDDFLFMPDSANIRERYKPVLDCVAKFMKTYDKIDVKVAGYQDNQGKKRYLQGLSERQAQVVANFLWYHDVNARLLYSQGYHQLNPVCWNGNAQGCRFNRRVEVSFRYYPSDQGYS